MPFFYSHHPIRAGGKSYEVKIEVYSLADFQQVTRCSGGPFTMVMKLCACSVMAAMITKKIRCIMFRRHQEVTAQADFPRLVSCKEYTLEDG